MVYGRPLSSFLTPYRMARVPQHIWKKPAIAPYSVSALGNDHPVILTLLPEKMALVKQTLVDFCAWKNTISFQSRSGSSIHLPKLAQTEIPKHFQGVLYLHQVPGDLDVSHLRIRLCDSVARFHTGTDLRVGRDALWTLSVRDLKSKASHRFLLDLIREELEIVPENKNKNTPLPLDLPADPSDPMLIKTLSPGNLISSGQSVCTVTSAPTFKVLEYGRSGKPIHRAVRFCFPAPGSHTGLLYFHHDRDCRKSELRFRLCADAAAFHKGSDLMKKNAQKPWTLLWKTMQNNLNQPRYRLIASLIKREWPGVTPQYISTLHPENIVASSPVFHISSNGEASAFVVPRKNDEKPKAVVLQGFSTGGIQTGLFYFDYIPQDPPQSQLRFRLCLTAAGFHDGQDALDSAGNIWKRTIPELTRSQPLEPLMDLILSEFDHFVPTKTFALRSLSPENMLQRKQQTIDISGLRDVRLGLEHTAVTPPPSDETEVARPVRLKRVPYHAPSSDTPMTESLPFPPGSRGVFYYKTVPQRALSVGELRFRLCSDVARFAEGTDLTFPSGDPWYVDVQQIRMDPAYRVVCDVLHRDGLVPKNFRMAKFPPPGMPAWSPEEKGPLRILSHISLRFVVELSQHDHNFMVRVAPSKWIILRIKGLFSPLKQGNNDYLGRVVVHFERYPHAHDGAATSSGEDGNGPILALRILEHFTPIQRISDEDSMVYPHPGHLHMIRQPRADGTPSDFRVWGFRTSDPQNRKMLLNAFRLH